MRCQLGLNHGSFLKKKVRKKTQQGNFWSLGLGILATKAQDSSGSKHPVAGVSTPPCCTRKVTILWFSTILEGVFWMFLEILVENPPFLKKKTHTRTHFSWKPFTGPVNSFFSNFPKEKGPKPT